MATVPEGGAPAFESGATWSMRGGAISATSARRTDREPFTWQRVLCQNGQGSVGNVLSHRTSVLQPVVFDNSVG